MESIQIFLKLDSLFKAEGNVPAKTIQFILNLDSWQKLIKIDLLATLDFDAVCSKLKETFRQKLSNLF